MTDPRYLTPAEFADRLRVHVDTVGRWRRDGMPVLDLGRIWRVKVAEAERWLEARSAVDDAVKGGRFVAVEALQ